VPISSYLANKLQDYDATTIDTARYHLIRVCDFTFLFLEAPRI